MPPVSPASMPTARAGYRDNARDRRKHVGRGAWRDNVFVERLWRSVKHEEVYLRAYDSVGEARASLSRYFTFYNTKRPHSSLDARTPDHSGRAKALPA